MSFILRAGAAQVVEVYAMEPALTYQTGGVGTNHIGYRRTFYANFSPLTWKGKEIYALDTRLDSLGFALLTANIPQNFFVQLNIGGTVYRSADATYTANNTLLGVAGTFTTWRWAGTAFVDNTDYVVIIN